MRSHVPHSLAIILTLTANLVPSVDAAPFALDVNVCNTDMPSELPSTKFPIGCEILDCCPGCRGPGPLEVRLDFAAPAGSETRLTVEGVPEAAVRALKLGGNAKWPDGGPLVLETGESSIQGWPSDSEQVPVFTPQVRFADATLKQLAKADSKGADQSAGAVATLLVTQFLGGFPVREFAVRYTIRVCPQPSSDMIPLSNNTGNDRAVVLLDARRSSGSCVNDEVWRGSSTLDVGSVFSSGNCRSEVAVFSEDNAVALQTDVMVWTDQLQDELPIELQPLVRESVTYWALRPDFAKTRKRVNDEALRANQLFNKMKGGIGFDTTAINNATADPDTETLLDANCDKARELRSKIGFVAGELNVYYNQLGGARGLWCGDDTIIIGPTADSESLAHEFGHAFTLSDTMITTANLMHNGTQRDSITIGQLFRTSVNSSSRVNMHGLRPGGATRNCPDNVSGKECPKLDLDVVR